MEQSEAIIMVCAAIGASVIVVFGFILALIIIHGTVNIIRDLFWYIRRKTDEKRHFDITRSDEE